MPCAELENDICSDFVSFLEPGTLRMERGVETQFPLQLDN